MTLAAYKKTLQRLQADSQPTPPLTSREKQQDYRARMTLLGLREVRGIYLPHALHAKLKAIAAEMLQKSS